MSTQQQYFKKTMFQSKITKYAPPQNTSPFKYSSRVSHKTNECSTNKRLIKLHIIIIGAGKSGNVMKHGPGSASFVLVVIFSGVINTPLCPCKRSDKYNKWHEHYNYNKPKNNKCYNNFACELTTTGVQGLVLPLEPVRTLEILKKPK